MTERKNCMFCSDKAETHRKDAISGEMVDICWDCDCARREWAAFSQEEKRRREAAKVKP